MPRHGLANDSRAAVEEFAPAGSIPVNQGHDFQVEAVDMGVEQASAGDRGRRDRKLIFSGCQPKAEESASEHVTADWKRTEF